MSTIVDTKNGDAMEMMEENKREVRRMVMESYQDMLDGKGRDYKEFFAELESKYRNADV